MEHLLNSAFFCCELWASREYVARLKRVLTESTNWATNTRREWASDKTHSLEPIEGGNVFEVVQFTHDVVKCHLE